MSDDDKVKEFQPIPNDSPKVAVIGAGGITRQALIASIALTSSELSQVDASYMRRLSDLHFAINPKLIVGKGHDMLKVRKAQQRAGLLAATKSHKKFPRGR